MRAAITKIPHLLYEKGLLKTPKVMYDFIYNLWFIYNECIWWGWEKKPEKRNEGKDFHPLVALPSPPPSMKWRPTVFRCPKKPKTSRTYPSGERDPTLMGQKNKTIEDWMRCGQLDYREYELYTCELSRSSTKAGWGTGWRTKNNGDGEDLEN